MLSESTDNAGIKQFQRESSVVGLSDADVGSRLVVHVQPW